MLKQTAISPLGEAFNLLELEGDARYSFLFILTIIPFAVALQQEQIKRGWLLVLLGNLIMILTLWLPTEAAQTLLDNREEILGVEARGARVQPVSAIAMGIFGGYIVLFGGLNDLRQVGVSGFLQNVASWGGVVVMIWLVTSGQLDVYSVMVEYQITGDNLDIDTLRHLTYVIVSLTVGLIIGIGLGLWASRDERIAPVILYAVGIIQTIPSLALFGLLLVPLSNLGNELMVDVLVFVLGTVVLAGVALAVFFFLVKRLPSFLEPVITVIVAAIAAVPISLSALMLVSFLFRVIFNALTSGEYSTPLQLFVLAIAAALGLLVLGRNIQLREQYRRYLVWARYGLTIVGFLALGYAMVLSADEFLPNTSISEWELSAIGIRGIGVTPSLVALTLYSLLPLVRNTYAGLNNVDPAIIDSGRGMGMTPWQIFFRIELPLAFPVIIAGIRNAAIALVGIATIATVVGGGGLGDYVLDGINNISLDKILLGTIPAILLAFALDIGIRIFENTITSPGIRQQQT